MPKFGNYAIATPVKHYFIQEPDWYWVINPVTTGDELEMSKFLNHRRILNTPEGQVSLPPTHMEIAFQEVAVTFGGTNIPEGEISVEEGGEAFLKEDASVEEIKLALERLPREMFFEIWEAVGDAYPYWGPMDPNEQKRQAGQK